MVSGPFGSTAGTSGESISGCSGGEGSGTPGPSGAGSGGSIGVWGISGPSGGPGSGALGGMGSVISSVGVCMVSRIPLGAASKRSAVGLAAGERGTGPLVPLTAILDVDGTLVDTNYLHAIAWYRAFRELDVVLPTWRIHRHIGMGGDQLVPALAGEDFEQERGGKVREVETERYRELIGEVEVLPGARALIEYLKGEGHTVILASSAKEQELDRYLELLGARELADGWTTSADVEATKPEPDLVRAALDRAGTAGADAVMVGDSTFDCEAASRAGVRSIAVLTGGFSSEELRESGAAAVYESVEELVRRIDETSLAAQAST